MKQHKPYKYKDGCPINASVIGEGHSFLPGCEKYELYSAGLGKPTTNPTEKGYGTFQNMLSMPEIVAFIAETIAHTEKRAWEEGYEFGMDKKFQDDREQKAYERGHQRGADEMLEKAIAMVPEEGFSSIKEGRPVFNLEARGFNKCREAILTSLRSIKSKE